MMEHIGADSFNNSVTARAPLHGDKWNKASGSEPLGHTRLTTEKIELTLARMVP